MERSKFIKAVLEEVGAIDSHEAVEGNDGTKVDEAIDRVVASLQARDVMQVAVIGTEIDDGFAQPLIMLVAYDVAPSYGYPRDTRVKRNAEMDVYDATNGPIRTQTLKKHSFL